MEPITHLLTGACLARTGLNRKSLLATATLVLAAEAPDLDVVTELGGRVFGFEHHRGFSHTFLGVPVVAAFVVIILWIYWRVRQNGRASREGPAPRWALLFLLGCLAALSHILLDFTNNYGVRPFMPFSYKWYSWDIVFIVEPLLWIILAGGLLLPVIFGMVDREIGLRRKHPRGRMAAMVALVLVVTLWGVRDYEHRRAINSLEALTYEGEDALRVSAYPYYVNFFHWYAVVETRDSFQTMDVDSRTAVVDPKGQASVRRKPEETPISLAGKKSYLGRVYLDWAQYPFSEVEPLQPPLSGYVVRFYDLRYAYPNMRGHPLSAWVELDPQLRVIAEDFGVRDYPGREQASHMGQGTSTNGTCATVADVTMSKIP